MTKILAFDLETGGLDKTKNPILTAYFAVLDDKLNVIEDLDLKIRPEAPFDLIDQDALRVNGININEHIENPETLSRQAAYEKTIDLLNRHGGKNSRDKNRLIPLGHNVVFDIDFVKQLVSESVWSSRVHYRYMCTSVLTSFFKMTGIFPENIGNLSSLVKYLNVPMGQAHTAKDDVIMMIECYKKMIDLVKNQKNSDNDMKFDILSLLEK